MKFVTFFFTVICICFVFFGHAQDTSGVHLLERTDAQDTSGVHLLERTAMKYNSKGAYDSTALLLQRAFALCKDTTDWQSTARCALSVGTNHYYHENFTLANAWLNESVVLAEKSYPVDSDLMAEIYNVQGNVYYQMGDYEKALASMKLSLEYYSSFAKIDSLNIVASLQNMAAIQSRLGNFDEAIALNVKCVNIIKRLDYPLLSLADTYSNLNVCFYRKRNYQKALYYSKLALAIYRELPLKETDRHRNLIACFNSIAIVYFEMKAHTEALDYLNKALHLHKNESYMIEKTYHNLGYVYRELGEDDKAVEFLEKAQQINASKFGSSHPDIGKAYRHLGVIAARKGRLPEAIGYYQKALNILVPSFSSTNPLKNPVSVVRARSRPDLLRTLYDKGKALYLLAEREKEGKELKRAIMYGKAAIDTYYKALDIVDLMRDEFELQNAKQFVSEEARPLLESALKAVWWLYNYDELSRSDYEEQAFFIMEKSKALFLLEQLQLDRRDVVLGVPDSLLQREKNLKRSIAYYKKQYEDASAISDKSREEIYYRYHQDYLLQFSSLKELFKAKYKKYYEAKFIRSVPLHEVREKFINEQTCYLEYFLGGEQLFTLSISKFGSRFYAEELPSEFFIWSNRYFKRISNIMFALDSGKLSYEYFVHSANSLYQFLLQKPLNDIPDGISKLCIVPDGVLFNLPFESMLTSLPGPGVSFVFMPYLIKQFAVTYTYSLQSQYSLSTKVSQGSLRCLAIAPGVSGNMPNNFSNQSFAVRQGGGSDIPNSLEEVSAIAKVIDGIFYFGGEASKDNFMRQASRFNLIHLATHAVADREYSSRSYLKFADAVHQDQGDGNLYGYDIVNLDLQADLVVLSACETAVGKYITGEGTLTLSRNFLLAGSKSVLSSLWRVEDRVSGQLMISFYKHLLKGYSKDESLREAKLYYLNQADNMRAHPAFWAPFILVGDPSAVTTAPYRYIYAIAVLAVVLTIAGCWLLVVKNKYKN